MNIDIAWRRARGAIVNAIVGGTAADGAAPAGGSGIAARAVFAIAVFALTSATWALARAHGILGTASLYFPATLLVALFAGWEFGLVTLAAGGALVWRVAQAQFSPAALALFALAGFLELLVAGCVRELLREAWAAERRLRSIAEQREREADTRELALGEARHRLKNLLAIIEALAKFSGPKSGADPALDTYLKRFVGRLRALGTASDLVLKQGLGEVEARAMIGAVLAPFMSESPPRLGFDGPPLKLSEPFGGALALALHELATNALKYGALSAPAGTIALQWTVTEADAGEHVTFLWQETGGPPPCPPAKDGFGHRLIRSVAQREARGEVHIDYPPQGLVCRIAYLRRPPVA